MPMIQRKQVIPGDVVAKGNYRYGSYIEKHGDEYVALRVGVAEVLRDEIKLNPLTGPYLPHTDDEVIGKVVDINGFGWVVDINSCFDGFLPASFVFGRDFSPATHDLSSKFRVGDIIGTRIETSERSRDPQLSIRGQGYGKIESGEIVKISPTKVPRVIGRRGAMINLISERTGCDVRVGQNGVVVVDGSPEGIMKAVKAIMLVEEETHAPDLMSKVEEALGGSAVGGN
ncbi:MAG: S1 RNA-binding domain-containing protein [Nitrososphaerota archaeon]|nr:S1 RNA-binding domain-containing protein [Nitrososphaerota archaeon]MDG6953004.1 S1 RNA-binding domain-containing protein [Nitrososphaerota archaeon]MDG6956917.1 S1 RNA-binding domain-containing protein [Nitrososphaerota archaeon]MDG6957262.1 S1 RNA-binding domain-containing protein [Nitrososphaerota archaeon]MDG6959893.1 S1 RNA-binding domain-containing protein [Nitrososphaerota archaeon]